MPDSCTAIPGLVTRDHLFSVPLNHAEPVKAQISIFAREVVDRKKDKDDLPWLVFFQGGPGFGAPRPTDKSGWLKRVLREYRVLMLDQRGTGRSTPVNHQSLAQFRSPEKQADYLKHFRADSIVRDAELIRKQLVGEDTQWTVYGQSYGGWCITTYLSIAPEGLEAALFTGGLPPIKRRADDVYRETFKIVEKKNERFYERYPDDAQRIREIVDYLDSNKVILPCGDQLTPRRFQQLGLGFYRNTHFETLHYLLEDAFIGGPNGQELSHRFLCGFEKQFDFETNPIFCLLHEAIYAQGEATNWAAERQRAEVAQFDASRGGHVLLTGEMIFPWMFDEYRFLRPMKETAEIIARYDDWPPLYDLQVLSANTVPCAAIVYYEDMCVVREFSLETARAIGNMKVWITNEYEHDASRVAGDRVVGRLLDMINGDVSFAF
ncbi:MAG: alpha/beta fold hydrolase [Planctomycetes bacterium]|nr:alpha/beta fold hydrolase [Planctomycetota bacterium]